MSLIKRLLKSNYKNCSKSSSLKENIFINHDSHTIMISKMMVIIKSHNKKESLK